MSIRILLAVALLGAATLAGCAGDDGSEPQMTGTQTQTDADTGTSTQTSTTSTTSQPPADGSGEDNTPPGATLKASMLRGAAPLLVNFTLQGADDDGDALAWSFDADGDGSVEEMGEDTNFSIEFQFNYTAAGLYVANLSVDDGRGGEVSKSLEVNVTAGGGEASSLQNWYFSADPDQATCVDDFLIQDLASAQPDGSICVFQVANPILGAAESPLEEVATAQAPSAAFDAGTRIEGSVYVSHTGADALVGILTVTVQINEGAVLGSQDITIVHDDPTSDYQADFGFDAAAEIPDGAVLLLRLNYEGPAAGIAWGGGPDAPTGFAVGGAYTPA